MTDEQSKEMTVILKDFFDILNIHGASHSTGRFAGMSLYATVIQYYFSDKKVKVKEIREMIDRDLETLMLELNDILTSK